MQKNGIIRLMQEYIEIKNANVHNLKNVSLKIPKNKMIVFTGVSGSGKSSLAFDTLYAEGQRRYVESLSSYARQFLGLMEKPDVESITGLSPAISIDQKTSSNNPRSTVGTITEIYDYLRLLFARVGETHCPKCGQLVQSQTIDEITDRIIKILGEHNFTKDQSIKLQILSPLIHNKKGEYRDLFDRLLAKGFLRVRVDGTMFSLDESEKIKLKKYEIHNIELIIDRLTISSTVKDELLQFSKNKHTEYVGDYSKRLRDAIELASNMSEGEIIAMVEDQEYFFAEKNTCHNCGISFPEITPASFSFNAPQGACEKCSGLGFIKQIEVERIYNPNLTIHEGGIFPWSGVTTNLESWSIKLLEQVAQEHKFDLDTPIGKYPQEVFDLIFYGKGKKDKYTVKYRNRFGQNRIYDTNFEGVVTQLERRYLETDSDFIRQDMEKYMIDQTCSLCAGKRLKPYALSVLITASISDKDDLDRDLSKSAANQDSGENINNDNFDDNVDNNDGDLDNSKSTKKDDLEKNIRTNDKKKFKAKANDDRKETISINSVNSNSTTSISEKATNIENIKSVNINELTAMPINECQNFLENIELSGVKKEIGKTILNEILARLQFLNNVGLNYLSLDRRANTLSGGESQRIRLASQIGTGLSGVLYVLDEPSIGLHPKDISKLIATLIKLRDLGNTLVVVEHDQETMQSADWIVDVGPLAGSRGGKIVAEGTIDTIKQSDSLTAKYLNRSLLVGDEAMKISTDNRFTDSNESISLIGASTHNLKSVNASFPIGKFICVTGVSGSGKSSLINDTLYPAIINKLVADKKINNLPLSQGQYETLEGVQNVRSVINIDQSPIGRTPRSNPVTYTGIFNYIRDIYASTPEAKARGYNAGRFSFNVRGGRCETCHGEGQLKIEMQFLPDMYVTCDACHGKRYNADALQIDYKGKNIAEVLDMTVSEAKEFFKNFTNIRNKLELLEQVGLDYIRLGQSGTTLSGGESQRIKLAKELSKNTKGHTLYILDEPTTGLHFYDVDRLLTVLRRLVNKGNTIIVVEHNLDVIKVADWIIDLGPEGGKNGGQIIAQGTLQDVIETTQSATGQFLKASM